MFLKNLCAAAVGTTLLLCSGLSCADEYHGSEWLSLDLPQALLSPKPLGPPQHFAPGPLDVRVARPGDDAQARVESEPDARIPAPRQASAEPKQIEPRQAAPKITVHKTVVAHARIDKSRGAARVKLARRHGNPLDAEAFDTRIQVWPCRSGGICDWKR
jgi:hypothetical protein